MQNDREQQPSAATNQAKPMDGARGKLPDQRQQCEGKQERRAVVSREAHSTPGGSLLVGARRSQRAVDFLRCSSSIWRVRPEGLVLHQRRSETLHQQALYLLLDRKST